MGNTEKRILFINSEIFPYVAETHISKIGRYLPQYIQEKGHEIRSFMPRYGCINERKNQLHEVIRLSGLNVIINEIDRPLIIKVASISAARLQVYFIDNEDYFRRKEMYCDNKGNFFPDNAERAIFFARSVLETVKKLRWEPDIIHCHGWISHVLPLYLKKIYKDDPIFSTSKVVLSLYNDTPKIFDENFSKLSLINGITQDDTKILEEPTGVNLAKLAAQYSDGIILGENNVNTQITDYCKELNLPILEYKDGSIEDGTYIDDYKAFYDKL